MLIAGTIVTKIVADNSQFKATLKDTRQGLGKTEAKTRSFSAGLKGMFAGVVATGLLAVLAKVSKGVVSLAADFESMTISIRTMAKSATIGDNLIKQLRDLANITPFTSNQLLGAAKSLISFGFAIPKVSSVLNVLGDISAGTGKNLKELAIIYGQIKSAGRLMGQDLLQLINAGFNPLQVISEKTGRSMKALKEDMSNGLITFDQVEGAFKDATSAGGIFFGLMNKQSASFSGRLSTLKDSLQQIGVSLGSIAIDVLKPIVDSLIVASNALKNVTAGKGTAGQNAAVGAAGVAGAGGALIGGGLLLGPAIAKGLQFAFSKIPVRGLLRAMPGASSVGSVTLFGKAMKDVVAASKSGLGPLISQIGLMNTLTAVFRTAFRAIVPILGSSLTSLVSTAAPVAAVLAAIAANMKVLFDILKETDASFSPLLNKLNEMKVSIGGFEVSLRDTVEFMAFGVLSIDSFRDSIGRLVDTIVDKTKELDPLGIKGEGNAVTRFIGRITGTGLGPNLDVIGQEFGDSIQGQRGNNAAQRASDLAALAAEGSAAELTLTKKIQDMIQGMSTEDILSRQANAVRDLTNNPLGETTGSADDRVKSITDRIFASFGGAEVLRRATDKKNFEELDAGNAIKNFNDNLQASLDAMFIGVEEELNKPLSFPTSFTAGGIIGKINEFFEFGKGQAGVGFGNGFGPFGGQERETRLGGAFSKGSVEANRILTQLQPEKKKEDEIANNTKLTADFLKKMLDSGVNINNVALAL